jgi:hypothetical protein
MKLWLLLRTDRPGWDEYLGYVVRAETEELARTVAARNSGDEGRSPWMTTATCKEIEAEGIPGIILDSFNAG